MTNWPRWLALVVAIPSGVVFLAICILLAEYG